MPSNEGGRIDHAALTAHDRYGVQGVVVWVKDARGRWFMRVCRAFAGRPQWPLDEFPDEGEHEDLDD